MADGLRRLESLEFEQDRKDSLEGSQLAEHQPILDKIVAGVVRDTPVDAFVSAKSFLESHAAEHNNVWSHASICAGSNFGTKTLEHVRRQFGLYNTKHRLKLAVELEPWKRRFILDNFPNVEVLGGDALELQNSVMLNHRTGQYVVPPDGFDEADIGFSCKNLSALSIIRGAFKEAILRGLGSRLMNEYMRP